MHAERTEFLFDSNVLIDVAKPDPIWAAWSKAQLNQAAERGRVFINQIIYAEVAPQFFGQADLDEWLAGSPLESRSLPFTAAWRAAEAFGQYRRAGGTRTSPLPDFYIGAHAETEGLTLVTRDAARYRTYFPGASLIIPDGVATAAGPGGG